MTTTDPFRAALEAALASKRPEVTDEMRERALQSLLDQAAHGDKQAMGKLLKTARLAVQHWPDAPAPTAEALRDGWIEAKRRSWEAAQQAPASVRKPAIGDGNESEWPAQYWRGPPDQELPTRPSTADERPAEAIQRPPVQVWSMGTGPAMTADNPPDDSENAAARERAVIGAERYRLSRQQAHETLADKVAKWMRG